MAAITSSRAPLLSLLRSRCSPRPPQSTTNRQPVSPLRHPAHPVPDRVPATATATAALFRPSTCTVASSLLRVLPSASLSSSARRTFSTTLPPRFRGTAANMVVTALKDNAAFQAAINPAAVASEGKKLVVVDCFATWCGPCQAIAPKVNEFSEKYPDVAFYKIDVDDAPDVAQELGVRAMPTFVFFKDGQKVDEVLGAVPPALEAAIQKNRA
uniref:Thioredoxin n=1 Tax=Coccidioides posadasii RMSCC 3488 TaxID=454284 RepID=A0A0J6FRQ8_COCPO|nr:thioredoxin [Coccidioides posadasii RMSCC 3488]